MSKQLAGIQGILGNYVTSPAPEPVSGAPTYADKPKRRDVGSQKPKRTSRRSARLGRPPGKTQASVRPKEKATLRIDSELMSDYRDWSWDARCQLGELIERALTEYRKRHR